MSKEKQDMNTIELPIKKVETRDVRENLTDNAYNQILPQRYLKRDSDGEIDEHPSELFERVGKNIAIADAVYTNTTVPITEDCLKDNIKEDDEHEYNIDDDETVELTEDNAKYVEYDALIEHCKNNELDDVVSLLEERADVYTEMMEKLQFMPNSPTLMNAGDELQQLSACFVSEVGDSMESIHESAKEASAVFQSGGGMGYPFSFLRPYGDPVGSTGGIASGPVSFMRTFDQVCSEVKQGGKRRGAQMGIMNVEHPDVIHFINAKSEDVSLAKTLRLDDPDDFENIGFGEALEEARDILDSDEPLPNYLRNAIEGHLSNFNISVGVTDDFLEAVKEDDTYTLKNPRTEEPHIVNEKTKEMYGWYGLDEHLTVGEELEIPAREIWEEIIHGAWKNGEPGVVHLDEINREHSYDVKENPEKEIHATNPCVTGDTLVATADGRGGVPIKELTNEESVPVYTREDDDVVVKYANNIRKTREDAEIYEIETDGKASLRLTSDHPVWTRNRGWVDAGDLREDDSLHMLYETDHSSGYRNVTWTGADSHWNLEHRLVAKHLTQSDIDEFGEDVRLTAQEPSNHKVVSVSKVGREDVYDLEVPETKNFYASDIEGEYVNIHNCGEQPLMDYEACNLGHINCSTILSEDAPDWRVWSDRNGDEYETKEEAVNAFLEEAIHWNDFDYRIENATIFLDNVVTMSDFPIEDIEKTVSENRKTGLGIMGIAQMFVQMGVKYGSETSEIIAEEIMKYITHESKRYSHYMATGKNGFNRRGVFSNWSDSKYSDVDKYSEWFEKHVGLDSDDWEEYEIRNHKTTTIAPTGTTSMVGNTTGGCEPMFNVAYYKNVSEDIQGEEILVEFDDYFIRTLEHNGIDVENVKDEARTLMKNDEFDGIESLDTVPDSLAEIFVTTEDLTAKEHARIQCSLQNGVDSGISKTVNAASDATKEDTEEAFMYVLDNGGKGVTYYRDGSRSKQVLMSSKSDQTEDDKDDSEELSEMLSETYESLTDFIQSDEFSEAFDETQIQQNASKRERPDILPSVTSRIETGYGKMYVILSIDSEGRPFDLFIEIGNSGGFTSSFTEALAKVISTALRSGVDPREVSDSLRGIRSPKVAWDNGTQVKSIPDAVGIVLDRYLNGELDEMTPESAEDINTQYNNTHENEASDDTAQIVQNGEVPECPSCGSSSLYYSEGCKTCENCGWSEC